MPERIPLDRQFPTGFVWGVATSAYQIEGAASEGGRAPSIWDTFSHTPGKILDHSNGDVACDHYHRYAEDVEHIANLGLDAYRFSVSWSRVQPDGRGAWNEEGMAFYARLIQALAEKKISAHMTLYHWDLPQALEEQGGWLNRDIAEYFARYAQEMAARFGDQVASIATHNEPWCTANLGYGTGQFAPGMQDEVAARQVSHHLLLSHGLAMQAMRQQNKSAKLGIVLNQWTADPATDSEADCAAAAWEYARSVQWFMDPIFRGHYPALALAKIDPSSFIVAPGDLEVIQQPLDFLGINYYFRAYISTETPPRIPEAKLGLTDMGWEIYPEGLSRLLIGIHEEYKELALPPIYITENGMAVADKLDGEHIHDSPRIDFMQRHLQEVAKAIAAGVNVQGFFYWSLLDNFEWNSGYLRRFGLIYVDYLSQRRIWKDSAIWFKNFVQKYRTSLG
ncbi:MAG: GH1 family beta-glucosidase [Candidatus Aquirickettsiella gammari]